MRQISLTILSVLALTASALAQDVPPGATTQPAATAPAATPAAPSEPPKKLAVGKGGLWQPGLLLQGWLLVDHADATTSTFRLRRAELSVKGEIVPAQVGYALMIDFAKALEFQDKTIDVPGTTPPSQITIKQPVGATAMLQDFFVSYLSPYADVSLGQFKIPVSWEAYNSTAKLLFPERATMVSKLADRRDLGVRVTKTFKTFGYSAGVFNGAGQNTLDGNNGKDLALRLEAYPVAGLVLAGVGYATVGNRDQTLRDRFEGDLRYESGPFLFQGELIYGRDRKSAGAAIVKSMGFYGALAYTLPMNLQPALRVALYDPDTGTAKDGTWQVDVGVNYYLRGHEAKAQLAYSRFQYQDSSKTADNQVILALQSWF